MRIKLRPIGLIKRFVEEQDREVPDGSTPRRLIQDLAIPAELKMMALVNGTRRDLDASLSDGDEIKLVTILTGG